MIKALNRLIEYVFCVNNLLIPNAILNLCALIFGIISFAKTESIYVLCFLISVLSLYLLFKKTYLKIFKLFSWFILGTFVSFQTIHNIKNIPNENVTIYAKIKDYTPFDSIRFKHRYSILFKDKQSNNNYNFHLYSIKKLNIEIDDTIKFIDIKILKPNGDSKLYFLKENIDGSIFDQKYNFIKIKKPRISIKRFLFETKQRLLNLKYKMKKNTFVFFSAIFLGNRKNIKTDIEEIRNQFQQWGLAHVLARAGLHLMLFIFLFNLILDLIPISGNKKNLIFIIICSFYTFFSFASIPFIRAWYFNFFNRICSIYKIQTTGFVVLTQICILILISSPLNVFFLDFQLSFFLTMALSWLSRIKYHPILSW